MYACVCLCVFMCMGFMPEINLCDAIKAYVPLPQTTCRCTPMAALTDVHIGQFSATAPISQRNVWCGIGGVCSVSAQSHPTTCQNTFSVSVSEYVHRCSTARLASWHWRLSRCHVHRTDETRWLELHVHPRGEKINVRVSYRLHTPARCRMMVSDSHIQGPCHAFQT